MAVATSSVTPEYHGNGSAPSLPWVVPTKLATLDRSSSTRSATGRPWRSRTSRRFSSAMPGDLALGHRRPGQVRGEPPRPTREVGHELVQRPLETADVAFGLVHRRQQVGEPPAGPFDRFGGRCELDPELRDLRDAHGLTLVRAGFRMPRSSPLDAPIGNSERPVSVPACRCPHSRACGSAWPGGVAPGGRGLHLRPALAGGAYGSRSYRHLLRRAPRHPPWLPRRPPRPSSGRRTAARSWSAAPIPASSLGAFATTGLGSRRGTRGRSRSSVRTTERSRSRSRCRSRTT